MGSGRDHKRKERKEKEKSREREEREKNMRREREVGIQDPKFKDLLLARPYILIHAFSKISQAY